MLWLRIAPEHIQSILISKLDIAWEAKVLDGRLYYAVKRGLENLPFEFSTNIAQHWTTHLCENKYIYIYMYQTPAETATWTVARINILIL